jgi:hypothetical protein
MSDHRVLVFVVSFLGTERVLVRVLDPVLVRMLDPVLVRMLDSVLVRMLDSVLAGWERSRLSAGWRSEPDGYRNGDERDHYCSDLHLFNLRI